MREMKDSGIPWIGEIPKTWTVIPVKRVKDYSHPYPIGDGDHGAIKPDDYQDEGIPYIRVQNISWGGPLLTDSIVYISEEAHSRSLKSELHPNDIVIAKTGATIGKTGIIPFSMPKANTTSSVAKLTVGQAYSNKFVFYLLGSDCCRTQMWLVADQKSAQPGFNVDELVDFLVPMPLSLSEQQCISDFLDSKCAEIDSVLKMTKASIEEYRELKQSVITEAVTKGIRGERPMQETGIDWVHSLPVEWQPVNPKSLFSLRKEKAYPGEKQLAASQQYGIIYQKDYMALTGAKIVTVEKDFDILKHVEAGDFVISMRSFQGGLEFSENTGSISSAYVMLKPDSTKVYNRFYKWLFKSSVYIDALCSTSNMVRDGQAMRYSNFAQIRLYTVPMDEQKEIATYLDEKCAAIDSLIASKERLISELEAYKKSLIYEYVTGKKEVPA
jgi:type I restriction enzyme S subunit